MPPTFDSLTPDTQAQLKDALAKAIGVVTGQGREELARFVDTYTPAIAQYAPLAAAGDRVAQENLAHLRAQMIMDASIYGVKVLQSQEKLLMTAIDIFTRVIVGLILPVA